MAILRLTPDADRLFGEAGENNTYFACPLTDLSSQDTVVGTNSSSFFDILVLTCPGPVTAAQLAGLTGFELVQYHASGNSVVLPNQFVAGTSAGIFAVVGGDGNDTANALGVTNGTRIAFYAGAGADVFVGGNGNDYAEFAAAELSAADAVNGGNGFDFLAFSLSGAVSAAALANVTSIEDVLLSNAGNTLTLANAFVAGADNGVMSVQAAGGSNTVDASGVTNGIRIAFYAGPGTETFIGGNGSDYLGFAANQLTAADQIAGGANYDIIEFITAGAVDPDAFANVTGIDELILNGGGNSVTLGDSLGGGTDNGVLVVLDGAGNDTVDASAVSANRVVFQSTNGNDSFTGGGGSDVALFDAARLDANDAFAGGAGFDILQLTSAGSVGSSAFANFSGVDELFLTLAGNTIALDGGVVASSDNGVFVVYDEAGHNIVDAGAATLGGRVVFLAIAGDHDTYIGGTGSDFFIFADANFNATDTLTGGNGSGTDFLVITTAASVTAADLANTGEVEVVQLWAGGSVELVDTLSNTGKLEVDGAATADTIDGSGVSGYDIAVKGNGGADTLKGGGGNDQFFLPDTDFVTIDGGAGIDKIVIGAEFGGHTFDLSSQVAKIAGIEAISLEDAESAALMLAPDDIAQINSSGNYLYVVCDSDDQVFLSGDWTVVETDHVNPAVSGTHTFTHYHNANGSDLYLDSLFSFTIPLM